MQNLINAKNLSLVDYTDELLYITLGDKVQEIALEAMLSEELKIENQFTKLVFDAVDETNKASAKELSYMYKLGTHPSRATQEATGRIFFNKLLNKLKNAICEEFYEDIDLNDNSKEILIFLIPTLITTLEIPAHYSTLAALISALIIKIGIRGLCSRPLIILKSSKNITKRLKIHEQNLEYLEQVKAHYSEITIPPELVKVIEWEHKQIENLRKTVNKRKPNHSDKVSTYQHQNQELIKLAKIQAAQPINVELKAMIEQSKSVEVEMNFHAPVTGATGKNEGVININVSEQKQTLAEAANEIQKLLKQLEETNPSATEPEQLAYLDVAVQPSLKQRTIAALRAGGETAIDEFFLENKYFKVGKAIAKAWLQPSS